MKIFITAGGTGGHIFPGVALFQELKDRGHDVFFITGKRDLRFPITRSVGYHLIPVPAAPLYRKKIHKNFSSIVRILKSIRRVMALTRGLGPDVVVGMGGYVTVPVLLVSWLKRIPVVICEQNAYPGLANRVFARIARRVLINFEDARDFLPSKLHPRIHTVGNPVRPGFQSVSRQKARKYFGLNDRQPVLGIVGGSQGARNINQALLMVLSRFKNVQILWSCGQKNYEYVNKEIDRAPNIKLFPFVEHMNYFLAASDLVVSRAGATSLAEISALGVPSVLIPYPYATGDHQAKNAETFRKVGASLVFYESEGLVEKFEEVLPALLENTRELQRMRRQSASLYVEETLERMGDQIEYAVEYSEGGQGE